MAKITRVAVTYGLTINLGDYNNVKPEVTYEAQLEKGEDESEIIAGLFDQAKHDIATLLKDQCMASLSLLNLSACEDYGDVESLCLKKSTLYRYIHNLSRKLAVEEIAYGLWTSEVSRRKQDNQAKQIANNIRHATPATIAMHRSQQDEMDKSFGDLDEQGLVPDDFGDR